VRFTAEEVAAATGGTVSGPAAVVEGATVDSRALRPGQLFVPVVAARDGHDFVADALAAGAAAYLTEREPQGGTAVRVGSTVGALADLGRAARARLPERVIGITGSVGKTTVKDLTAAVLRQTFPTAASARSFNNELGVPLTLVEAPDGTEATVLEMGARGHGHIGLLCDIGRPTIGVVTVVAAAHTEMFGTVDDVATAKGELVAALPPSGTAVLNAGDERVRAMAARTEAGVLLYGTGGDVAATAVTLDDELRPSFRLRSPWGEADVRLAVRGLHQVDNALAAAGAALAAGALLPAVVAGLGVAELSPWRMQLDRTPAGAVVLNDAYNANPTSTSAALRSLAALPARRRVAVLGTMAELGVTSDADHRGVAALAAELGIEVLAVGEPAYGVETVADVDAALAALGELHDGDAVLVKGSRVAGLERLAAALLSPARA
jgi:UDP-N-acetylmuramoyl-tripeptide--D-alanyl-D-alanine ligase